MEHKRSIVILDFGGQYAHLIARRVREYCGAFSEILPPETPVERLRSAAGIILSGGPQSVYDQNSPKADPKIFELGIPVLGICYGHHWMAHTLGGEVKPGKTKEYGKAEIAIAQGDPSLFARMPQTMVVWMSHGDEVAKLAEGFRVLASSGDCRVAAMADDARKLFGVQFHPEVAHTVYGRDILHSFVMLCSPEPWSIESYAIEVGRQVKEEVGDRKVFMLVSGGVDSTVAFTLLNEVLGRDRVQGLLVDTGLMRKNEVSIIQDAFDRLGIKNLRVVDASDEFFKNLEGVFDPEEKRKIIGNTFLAVQKRVSEEMGLHAADGWMLGQGTIYPDTIETGGTKHADHIKTHHNRVPGVQEMIAQGLVIEPLKDLYKDEVRRLGEELGLPHELVWRHPFPGPGLGVRILCAREPEHVENSELPIDVPHTVLPVKSVGVQGDGRTYRHAVALFAPDPYDPPEEFWALATSIPNAYPTLNRVLLCTSHPSPHDFIFQSKYLTRDRADLLREADQIVDEEMHRANLYEKIWQFPVVLLPIGMDGGQSIVLRPVESQEAMTANAARLPREVLWRMTERVREIPGIDCVFLDMTNKPPGTIEWE